jgi:uncharacterized protein with PIN domain
LRPAGAGSSGTRCHWYMLTVYGKQELVRAAKEYTAADLAGQSWQHNLRVMYEKKRKQDALVEEGFERCQHCHTPLVGADDLEQEQKLEAMEAIACGWPTACRCAVAAPA